MCFWLHWLMASASAVILGGGLEDSTGSYRSSVQGAIDIMTSALDCHIGGGLEDSKLEGSVAFRRVPSCWSVKNTDSQLHT